jgi:hypothetical protein
MPLSKADRWCKTGEWLVKPTSTKAKTSWYIEDRNKGCSAGGCIFGAGCVTPRTGANTSVSRLIVPSSHFEGMIVSTNE